MLLLATSYDQIKSALSLSMISMANLQSVFLAEDQILSLKYKYARTTIKHVRYQAAFGHLKELVQE